MAGLLLAILPAYYIETKYIRFDPKAIWWKQILKVILGLAITFLFKEGLKFIFPEALFFEFLRYFFIGLGAVLLSPWLFIKFKLSKKQN